MNQLKNRAMMIFLVILFLVLTGCESQEAFKEKYQDEISNHGHSH